MKLRSLGPVRIGAAIGAGCALLGLSLSGLFLVLVGTGPVGKMDPFSALTATGGVSPPTAATWTYLDAHGVRPTISFETDSGTDLLIVRGVLNVLDGQTDNYWPLGLVPPALLVCAGWLATSLVRRFDADGGDGSKALHGAYIVAGYAPALTVAGWLANVPVAPGASGPVRLGASVVQAATVRGVTAGPTMLWTVPVSVAFPTLFGLLGGLVSPACLVRPARFSGDCASAGRRIPEFVGVSIPAGSAEPIHSPAAIMELLP